MQCPNPPAVPANGVATRKLSESKAFLQVKENMLQILLNYTIIDLIFNDGTWSISSSSQLVGFDAAWAIDREITTDGTNIFKSLSEIQPWIQIDFHRNLKIIGLEVHLMIGNNNSFVETV